MIEDVVIKKLNCFEDERGWLAEFFRSDETGYQPVMGYISMTKPGVIRGPHEHVHQSDMFVFTGPGDFELHLWDRRDGSLTKDEYVKLSVGADNPTAVIVPPGVVHGYKCVSKIDAYCINLPDKLYKGKDKKEDIDEIRWEDDLGSHYEIK